MWGWLATCLRFVPHSKIHGDVPASRRPRICLPLTEDAPINTVTRGPTDAPQRAPWCSGRTTHQSDTRVTSTTPVRDQGHQSPVRDQGHQSAVESRPNLHLFGRSVNLPVKPEVDWGLECKAHTQLRPTHFLFWTEPTGARGDLGSRLSAPEARLSAPLPATNQMSVSLPPGTPVRAGGPGSRLASRSRLGAARNIRPQI